MCHICIDLRLPGYKMLDCCSLTSFCHDVTAAVAVTPLEPKHSKHNKAQSNAGAIHKHTCFCRHIMTLQGCLS